MISPMPDLPATTPPTPRSLDDFVGRLRAFFEALAELFGRPRRPAPPPAADAAMEAAEALALALAEDDAVPRLARLRAALAQCERLTGEAGDIMVMEASMHLGERLRALGESDEAVAHFGRAVERSFRVPDPVGRQRRAGVLSRLGILEQEAGNAARARQRYEEALVLGRDADGPLLLGMLTQAAFNLGLLDTEGGDDDSAVRSWERAIELGARAAHPSGWDPAAVAAFNLGHLYARRGESALAREKLEDVGRIAEPGGTPLGLMASAKAALALAAMAEREGLFGEPEAALQYRRAVELGRACQLPEGALAAVQAAVALGEQNMNAGRHAESVPHYRDALEVSAGCESAVVERFVVLAELRIGQALGESGDREAAAAMLECAFERGRGHSEVWVRELAAQAACTLHRVLCGLERWEEARTLAGEAGAFAASIASPTGRALAAAAAYALAFGMLHEGDSEGARAGLDEVARAGFESGVEVGDRIGLDALLLAGHLDRQAGRRESALALFRQAVERLRDRRGAEADSMAAMALVNAGHCLLALERIYEAGGFYERALARGRSSGLSAGRAAAANAALNLAALLDDESDDARRRELYGVAIALGRSSGTPLGRECAAAAEKGIAEADGEDGEAGTGDGE
jgi:tetratricopeptide (TPR) repeat protein